MADLPALNIDPLPAIDLRHLFVLTDDTAMLQHASRATPNLHHGYCTDDNARALIATVKLHALPKEHLSRPETARQDLPIVTQRYLAFLAYAFDPKVGRFRNFMQYDRSWREKVGSEDSQARALWALGKAVRFAPNTDVREMANQLMLEALPAAKRFSAIRPWAYALLGVEAYLDHEAGQELAVQLRATLAERLYQAWKDHATDDWPWWEDELTWGNAKLPHAMMVAGVALERPEMVEAALSALRWLADVQTGEAGQLSIVGNHGWYRRGGERARFDQQPIEAKGMVQSCVAAAGITGEAWWTRQAKRAFDWFIGRNDIGAALYNPGTGGCHDGLGATGINANQGAESTLAYLLSVLVLHHYDRVQRDRRQVASLPDFA